MPTTKPQLGKLSTPITATFPSEITSASTATPLSSVSCHGKLEPTTVKTPISPPSAYTDFLSKAMGLKSPSVTSNDSSLDDPEADPVPRSPKTEQSSPTSTASNRPSSPTSAPTVPPSPFPKSAPMSAPPSAISFPSLKLPPSPAISNIDSPLTASTVRSPFSARSVHSVFDWDAALKARFADKKQKASRTSVRHIREVVTRTVTYTPRMEPAPRGKRRKVE